MTIVQSKKCSFTFYIFYVWAVMMCFVSCHQCVTTRLLLYNVRGGW